MNTIKTREIWRPGNGQTLSNERRLSVVSRWLSDCRETHDACRSSTPRSSTMPTRVIDVNSNPVRLYEPSKAEVAEYAALSYCWGKAEAGDINIETTTETIAQRKSCLFLANERVPATILDAIEITKRLGIPYLWIDALCIIQHDKEWEDEAAKMHSVYQEAAITLSATESKGCSRGFFSTSMNKPSSFEETSLLEEYKFGSQKVYACLESVKDNIHQSLSDSPLGARGWTFQESVLSRRLVHFTNKQLIWECKSQVTTEDGMLAWGPKQIPRQFTLSMDSAGDLYQSWESVVKDYSRRSFSKPEDRVYALAGVTSLFQAVSRDDPMLGLWRGELFKGLLWHVPNTSQAARVAEMSDVPSWSWMSVGGEVQHHSIRHGDQYESSCDSDWISRHVEVPESRDTFITWEGTPFTSKVGSAALCLRGPVMSFQTLKVQSPSLKTYLDKQNENPTSALLILSSRRRVYQGGGRSIDTASQRTVEDFYFLLLSPSPPGDKYRRVGIGIIEGNARCRDFALQEGDSPRKTVTIT